MITAAEILQTDEFTKPVILPDGSTVRGVFDNQSADPLGINTVAPQVTLAAEVAAGLVEDDVLRVAGTSYQVRGKEHDDEGLTVVQLGDWT
jgi:hypothetical protein